jgi:ABC-type lipoprotein release transport system permease subunit
MLVGLSAWLVAVPLSFLLAEGLISSLGIDEFIEGIGYERVALVIGLIGILLITALASLGPSMSAARRTVSEILRYQ